ncbi:MAG TPA: glycosyltransferase [Desulfomonilaceae bacterium]|nr:glycosyltransferase [Desulfomonilaceae bacterium]
MLNIGVIIPQLAKYGGAERLVLECVSRWQNRHRITIYASKFSSELLSEHRVGEFVSLVKITPYFEGEHAPLLNCVLLPKIWEHEIGEHDVYNAHLWPTHLIDVHPMVWYPHEPLRVLDDLRGDELLDSSDVALRRRIHLYPKQDYLSVSAKLLEAYLNAMDLYDKVGKPERIVANSRFSAQRLEHVYQRRVTDVVYPGVNLEDFMPVWPPSLQPAQEGRQEKVSAADENVFITIGQLWPHKRINLVIEALRLVDGAQLYVIGDGPEKDPLEDLAGRIGVADRVFFLSGLSNLELRITLARCLAVVFVPRKEPFGIVALEAMAAGRPLICADEGGFTEVVDESCAFLLPPRLDLIAEKMRLLRSDRALALRMGKAGRAVASLYRWDKTASEILAILEATHDSHRSKSTVTADVLQSRRNENTLFGIQYYCWYGDGYGSRHWDDNPLYGSVTDTPLSGFYESFRRSTMESHFKLLEDVGLDFLILNLHVEPARMNSYEKATIENLFRVADAVETKLHFAIQLCPAGCSTSDLVRAMEHVWVNFVGNSHYLCVQEKPVLYVFWTGEFDGRRQDIDQLKEGLANFVRIATSLRPYDPRGDQKKTMGLFDGFSLISPLDVCDPARWRYVWQTIYERSSAGNLHLRIFTVSPGYDDSHLQDPARKGNIRRKIRRDNGQTYRAMLDCALALEPHPHQVLISSFNEYHENSHIEPSLKSGFLYMEMTREFIETARKKWAGKVSEGQ